MKWIKITLVDGKNRVTVNLSRIDNYYRHNSKTVVNQGTEYIQVTETPEEIESIMSFA